ncbi:hypothetical protein ACYZT4_10460 [Pseudomonas sp. GB2N2]
MSTLSEIAANHAKMLQKLAGESTEMCERLPLVVGSFEVTSVDDQPHMPLHQIPGVQDNPLGLVAGYAL